MSLETKVYVDWAYTNNEEEKRKINLKIYDSIKNKILIINNNEKLTGEMIDNFTVITPIGNTIRSISFKLLSSKINLSRDEIALFIDDGNLCFGYDDTNNIITVFTN